MTDWRVLYLGFVWLLIAASMYAVIFWTPLLISAMFGQQQEQQLDASPAGGEGAPSKSQVQSCGEGH